ncbi:type IV pilus modification protein PilV [Pseudomonas sp. UME83]|nr:type IV pilus modification protein PilV [Pseudomonas sp. UMC76]MBB1639024.1 type IV pilus modification protein PilV [Pseudomonas sp. UME83]NTX90168.1 type IV pilus modification protein PilV [Pseudomonas sp. UMA643]NTY20698.1 type IV pilus modification protein PilV [Pseudomonas sp. UMC3103]NTY26036.1 type IV pilus modification protein PilV [Pseudomonas sp. UMA603]NTY30358.1 type IV pilus modification protein PilV [Pseudomonas sp. UMC3129]NTY56166.1 type IV pilus modification protein PilV [P
MLMSASKYHHMGFSLIEVLISLLLICVGILGMVALQSKAIPYTQDSVQRSSAQMLASDLMELIRSDSANVSSYVKNTGSDFPNAPDSCVPMPDSASDRLGCWAARAKTLLPGADSLLKGDFYICKSKTPGACDASGSAVEIQIAWTSKAGECMDESSGTTCHYRLRTGL